MGLAVLLLLTWPLLTSGNSILTLFFANGEHQVFNAPVYRLSAALAADLNNASVYNYPKFSKCSLSLLPDQSGDVPSVLFAVLPLCYPHILAGKALQKNFSALVIASQMVPVPGLWALSFWKAQEASGIPIFDIKIDFKGFSSSAITRANIAATGGRNYFQEMSSNGGFIFLLVIAFIANFVKIGFAIQRLAYNLRVQNKKDVRVVIIMKLLSGILLFIMLIDPVGVYGYYNFPAVVWLTFFFVTCSEMGMFTLGMAFQKILAHEMSSSKHKKEMIIMAGSSVFALVANFVFALMNTFAGAPDGFILILVLYAVLQILLVIQFIAQRLEIVDHQLKSKIVDPYTTSFTNRAVVLLSWIIHVNIVFLLVIQPVAAGVIYWGDCATSRVGNCSPLLLLLVLSFVFMSVTGTLLVAMLPGESKEEWMKRHKEFKRQKDLKSRRTTVQVSTTAEVDVIDLDEIEGNPTHLYTKPDTLSVAANASK
eukprot:TRINITY_DN1486_c0_g3_i1.p1 TRINITY_DN1486_c0_g3~~TRINITY_DN1486_c0_g3_i1.p1  ORF type:complete len:481 (-),score=118.78 TRINITY_DN1486_c0_g3_i1:45-1487(-)